MSRMAFARPAVALALLALPAALRADDAPGFFPLPGTSTQLQIYGYVALDAAYDNKQGLGDFGTIVNAIQSGRAGSTVDGFAPENQWTMTANRSRFGFASSTPSDFGDITAKVEGDFLTGTLRLRHAYGTIGPMLIGRTWSTFMDLDALPETVDFTGAIGWSNFDTPRMAQVRYTLALDGHNSAALAIEKDQTGSTNSQFPGGVVGVYTYKGDWGHAAARVLMQRYGTFTPGTPAVGATPASPEVKFTSTAFAWQLSGHFQFGKDALQWSFLTGKGLGAYGAGFQAIGATDPSGERYDFWKSNGYSLGYAHVWTGKVRSNLVLSQLDYKRDDFTVDTDIHRVQNGFLNTFITFAKNAELGIEYAYGNATAFAGGAYQRMDGSRTDSIKESRLQMAMQFNFF